MKRKFKTEIIIPEGVSAEFRDSMLILKKGSEEVKRKMSIPGVDFSVKENKFNISSEKANKKIISFIKSNVAHFKNMLKGLESKFTYEMEIVFVHFPITAKIEGKKLVISNFLGEKVNRKADILDGVDVKLNGQSITISSNSLEKAGQTAANIEKSTKISNRDRRIFQDGIFITSKPGGEI